MPVSPRPAGRREPPSRWAEARRVGDSDVYWRAIGDTVMVWHWCNRPGGGRWVAAACRDHTVVSLEPLHLEPSLACTDCSWHGFIRAGVWQPV